MITLINSVLSGDGRQMLCICDNLGTMKKMAFVTCLSVCSFEFFFFIYFIPRQLVFFPVKFPFPYFQMTQHLTSFFGEHCHISSWFLHFSPRESPRKGEGTVMTAEVKIECLRAGQSHIIAQLKEEIDYVELQYTGRIIYKSLSLDQQKY